MPHSYSHDGTSWKTSVFVSKQFQQKLFTDITVFKLQISLSMLLRHCSYNFLESIPHIIEKVTSISCVEILICFREGEQSYLFLIDIVIYLNK